MDPGDQQWDDDDGMKIFWAFVEKYTPVIDIGDSNYLFGYTQGVLLERLVRQCGDDLSHENVLKQAKNLRDVAPPRLCQGSGSTPTKRVI